MKISAAYITNQGKIRSKNQDNLYFIGRILKLYHMKANSKFTRKVSTKKAVCFGIFDGMGGEQYGEMASYLAVRLLRSKLMEKNIGKIPMDFLCEFCYEANQLIYQKTNEYGAKRIGTTAAIAYIQYDRFWGCNVGDSRIYRFRNHILSQLSYDHIDQSGNGVHYKAGLTQHLGMSPEEKELLPYIFDEALVTNDIYVICTDGLTDMVSKDEIADILENQSSISMCNKLLVKKALENGGRDNITIITLRVK